MIIRGAPQDDANSIMRSATASDFEVFGYLRFCTGQRPGEARVWRRILVKCSLCPLSVVAPFLSSRSSQVAYPHPMLTRHLLLGLLSGGLGTAKCPRMGPVDGSSQSYAAGKRWR